RQRLNGLAHSLTISCVGAVRATHRQRGAAETPTSLRFVVPPEMLSFGSRPRLKRTEPLVVRRHAAGEGLNLPLA
ncbi:MAG: hypothetical protein M0Z85_09245, partial [Gammaproteobacteria bacterium]|nr:hypothetical protein [Gammaproteobacteria bacterium]